METKVIPIAIALCLFSMLGFSSSRASLVNVDLTSVSVGEIVLKPLSSKASVTLYDSSSQGSIDVGPIPYRINSGTDGVAGAMPGSNKSYTFELNLKDGADLLLYQTFLGLGRRATMHVMIDATGHISSVAVNEGYQPEVMP